MDFDEYRESYLNEISNTAIAESLDPVEAFIKDIADLLKNDLNLINNLNLCYYEWRNGNKSFKSMKIDAYSVEQETNTINLLIADYNNGEIKNITNEDKNTMCALMINFFENVLKGFFKRTEQSALYTQASIEILENKEYINKIHLYIVSTNKISNRIKDLNLEPFIYLGKVYNVILDVIDFDRIYKIKMESVSKEEIVINTSDFNVSGIPCIKADLETKKYDSYLAVMPGEFLADIYDKYGLRLLEANVRSFLSFRGAINKGIRGTILNAREKFFTYNNGISVTAKDIECKYVENEGLMITKFVDLQIINGGQTTASLSATRVKDNASLKNIYVQMKLTIVREEDLDFVRNIAKYANSQNKVTSADLNSNHPFYVRIEDFSRKIYAPTMANGSTYQELWFFERARGQYEQPMMKMNTKKERDDYQKIRPKDKKFTKMDLAKYVNSADMLPHYVSWGSEVNATKFQERMEKQWEKDDSIFNDYYYKEIIGMAILYKSLEKIISKQEWYIENKAYRPQLVTYTFSKFVYEVKKINLNIDYKKIWDKQAIPAEMEEELAKISKLSYDNMYGNREIANISTYCKNKLCWERLQRMPYTLSPKLFKYLISDEDRKVNIVSSKKSQKIDTKIDYSLKVFNKGEKYWEELLNKGINQHILNYHDIELLKAAKNYCITGNKFTDNQAIAVIKIADNLKENGIE